MLALVSSAPAWANLVSLAYARRAQGRPKVAFLQPLLVAWRCASRRWRCCRSAAAAWSLFLVLYGAARLLWAGVDTVRSVIWSVNYPRHLRARSPAAS